MDKKSYDNGMDFSFVQQKVREEKTTIENAVKTSNYQELNQSITKMVNNTLKQYQKEHPTTVQKKTEHKVMNPKYRKLIRNLRKYRTRKGKRYSADRIRWASFRKYGNRTSDSADSAGCNRSRRYHFDSSDVDWYTGRRGDDHGGCTGLGRLKRFKKYVQALGDRTYCDFERLAGAVGRSVKFVKKDIKFMIQKGWFLEGQTDQKETCLITSTETYRQYTETQKALEKRKEEECRKSRKQSRETYQSGSTGSSGKGEEFIQKIHASNDAIPGEEISQNCRMEQIVEQIFQRAGEHPEIIPDLKKMMDYYLPMTVKLLDAYEEMDRQPIQGETIRSSKKEIEETLDTLNEAFAKLLDSVFQDTAWDVSSDISVLHTMLAQEGLTGNDFSKKQL